MSLPSAARRTVRGTLWLGVPLTIVTLLTSGFAAPADERVATNFLISVVLVLGIQIFSGNSGILSFGQVAFMGVGAYVAAIVSIAPIDKELSVPNLPSWLFDLQLSFVPTIIVATGITTLCAFVVGLPLVRMRDNAMVMATFAMLGIFSVVFASWNRVTGGVAGLYGVPSRVTLWLALAFAVAAAAAARLYRELPAGFKVRASREDPLAAAALGANVARLRLGAWVLSAALMGLGGAVWAQYNLAFGPQQFTFAQTFNLLAMLVVGGLLNVSGAVIGAFVISLATELLRRVEDSTHVTGLTQIAIALVILVILRARPLGIVGWHEIDDAWARSRLRTGLTGLVRAPAKR
jgi:branched-chain amino acid transport system permease protein